MNERLADYLSYFEQLAFQPANHWSGFDIGEQVQESCDIRSQIAFACCALAVLGCHADSETADKERCRAAMAALIERMFQRRIWAYWAVAAEQESRTRDPIAPGNGSYSGPLAMMLGAFEAAGGDRRFDDKFLLFWTSDERYVYTHTTLVEALWQQMRSNPAYAIHGHPGRVETMPMAQALWALTLHDAVHGSDYAAAVSAGWFRFLRRAMVLHGPRLPGRGAFSTAYFPKTHLALPYGNTLNDAASLALFAALEPEFTRRLAKRFLPQIKYLDGGKTQAFAPGFGNERACSSALASGFSYVLAIELEEAQLAHELLSYAEEHLMLPCNDAQRCFGGPAPTPYLTALFAIGEAGGFKVLRNAG